MEPHKLVCYRRPGSLESGQLCQPESSRCIYYLTCASCDGQCPAVSDKTSRQTDIPIPFNLSERVSIRWRICRMTSWFIRQEADIATLTDCPKSRGNSWWHADGRGAHHPLAAAQRPQHVAIDVDSARQIPEPVRRMLRPAFCCRNVDTGLRSKARWQNPRRCLSDRAASSEWTWFPPLRRRFAEARPQQSLYARGAPPADPIHG
jgi:hypothetical protein